MPIPIAPVDGQESAAEMVSLNGGLRLAKKLDGYFPKCLASFGVPMNDVARQKLCQMIAQYGVSVCEDARLFEGLLRDFCGGHKLEINVLTKALQDRVVDDLIHPSGSVPLEMLLKGLSKRLQDNWGFSEESASWSVESWALALGRLSTSTSQRHNPEQAFLRTNSTPQPELTQQAPFGHEFLAIKKVHSWKLALALFLLVATAGLIWWLHRQTIAVKPEPNALRPHLDTLVISPTVKLAGIEFETLRHGDSSRRYLLIHGNEDISRKNLKTHLQSNSGIAYLVTGHDRFVRISSAKIDPNRMFSREGAEDNLRMLNPRWSSAQIKALLDHLDLERESLVRALFPPSGGLLVALHNTTRHSVNDEIPFSDKFSLPDPANPRDFFLCTEPSDFAKLSRSPFNVVLQNQVPKEDDGSLSKLAARLQVRYLNIEADSGKQDKQAEMLAWVERNLP